MEPVIPDGATVAVDTQNKKIVDGELYAINQGGLKRIKQLYRRPGGKVTIRSFNREENEDEEALESDLEIVGFVFWYSVIRYRK
ncbi:HTH-type transcriptional regulator PrtR [compost metagenome]